MLTAEYPFAAPMVRFTHQVLHPHISLDGQTVDSAILKHLWSPTLSLVTLICHIRDMLRATDFASEAIDGPAGEVAGGRTRVVGAGSGRQAWVVGAQCAGLWLEAPHTAAQVTRTHTARCANHSLVLDTGDE
jgi:hypothetical protein